MQPRESRERLQSNRARLQKQRREGGREKSGEKGKEKWMVSDRNAGKKEGRV